MTETNDYECELSNSWTLIQLNQNKEPSFVLESDKKQNLPQSLSSTTKDDTLIQDSNLNQVSQGATKGDKVISENDFFKANIPKKVEGASPSDGNSNVQDKNSDDSDSIEIIDLEGDYRVADINEQDISLNEEDEECDLVDDTLNFDDMSHDIVNLNAAEPETNLRKRTKNIYRKTLTLTSLSGAVTCCQTLGSCEEKERDLKVQVYKSQPSPLYYQYGNRLKNATISLTFGVLFAGILCLVIGQILGVRNSSEDLMKTLKTLKLENAALQSELSKINTAFFTKTSNFNPKQYFYTKGNDNILLDKDKPIIENNIFVFDNSSMKHLSESQFNQINPTTLTNKYKKKIRRRKGLVDFSKILSYIEHRLSGLNLNYNQAHLKRLEESTAKISDILQTILHRISSDNNPTRSDKKPTKAHQDKKTIHLSKGPLPLQSPFDFNWNIDKDRIKSPTSLYTFHQPKPHYEKTFTQTGKKSLSDDYSRENNAINSDLHTRKTVTELQECEERGERSKCPDINITLHKRSNSTKSEGLHKGKKLPHHEPRKKSAKLTNGEKLVKNLKDGVKSKIRKPMGAVKDQKFRTVNKKVKKNKYHKGRIDGTNFFVRKKGQKLHGYEKDKDKYYNGNGNVVEIEGVNLKEDHDGHWQFERAEAREKRRWHVGDVSKNGDWMFRWADGREEFRKENGNENWQFERASGRNEMRHSSSFYQRKKNWTGK